MTTSTDLWAALEAVILEHEYCGELDGGVEDDRARSVGRLGLYAAHALLPVVLAACAGLASGDKVSEGLYRLPYDDGTRVRVSNDHRTHRPPNRLDLVGVGAPPRRIVAAADGIVRYIVDEFDARQDRTARQCYNNYVWLEHSNGEWTKYSHVRQHSVRRKANLREGNTVGAGTYLGDEGDVGCATGPHLHFEVAVPYDRNDPITPTGGFIKGRNLVPRICGVPAETLIAGTVHLAGQCGGGLRACRSYSADLKAVAEPQSDSPRLPRPSYDLALWALSTWLDSWAGIGRIALGMHRQGFDLQLTQYDERGWRATFYTTGMEHSPMSATGTGWGRTPWHAAETVKRADCAG